MGQFTNSYSNFNGVLEVSIKAKKETMKTLEKKVKLVSQVDNKEELLPLKANSKIKNQKELKKELLATL
jgi:hypothetical protein